MKNEMKKMWPRKYTILNEDMIVAVDLAIYATDGKKYFWKYYINICTFFIF